MEIVQSPPNIAASNEGGEGEGGNGRMCFGRIQGGSPKKQKFYSVRNEEFQNKPRYKCVGALCTDCFYPP